MFRFFESEKLMRCSKTAEMSENSSGNNLLCAECCMYRAIKMDKTWVGISKYTEAQKS